MPALALLAWAFIKKNALPILIIFNVIVFAAATVFYVQHLRHQVASLMVAKVAAEAKNTVGVGQAAATTSATSIADQGAKRDALDITLHQDNAHAIQNASGAGAPVDPSLNDVGRRGLCHYAAYASDPSCAGLLKGDPAKLP